MIAQVIGEYTTLRSTGKELRGLCPLHDEKTPSFYVDAEKGVFHCFGCGAGGDSITFIMMHHSVGFTEARRILGMDEYERKPDDPRRLEMDRWRAEMSVALGLMCWEAFRLAEFADKPQYDEYVRRFAMAAAWQDDLWHGQLESLYESRQALERITR